MLWPSTIAEGAGAAVHDLRLKGPFHAVTLALLAGMTPLGGQDLSFDPGLDRVPTQRGVTQDEMDTCVVDTIVDGDTVECANGERIRLLMIGAPDAYQGSYGERSKRALKGILPPGTPATIELDEQERDPAGWILAHLHTPEGVHVNLEMVRLGYAVVVITLPNVRHAETFKVVARAARRGGRGLWGITGPECGPGDLLRDRCDPANPIL